jgi:hypothetical protein
MRVAQVRDRLVEKGMAGTVYSEGMEVPTQESAEGRARVGRKGRALRHP